MYLSSCLLRHKSEEDVTDYGRRMTEEEVEAIRGNLEGEKREMTGSECWRGERVVQDRFLSRTRELDEGRISVRKQGGRGGHETEDAVLCPATWCQYWSTAVSSCWRLSCR